MRCHKPSAGDMASRRAPHHCHRLAKERQGHCHAFCGLPGACENVKASLPDHNVRPLEPPGPGLWDNCKKNSTLGGSGATRPSKPAIFEETPAKHMAFKAIVRVNQILFQAAAAVFRHRDPKKRPSIPPDLVTSIRPSSSGPITAMICKQAR